MGRSDQTYTSIREGTIAATLRKSDRCIEYLKDKETDILNLDFEKEYIVTSFMIDAPNGQEHDVKDKLLMELEKNFNDIANFEKIWFIRMKDTNQDNIIYDSDEDSDDNSDDNSDEDYLLHLIDFQILLKNKDPIIFTTPIEGLNSTETLKDQIIKALKNSAETVFTQLNTLHTAQKYSRAQYDRSIKITPLEPVMTQEPDRRWYWLAGVLIIFYFIMIKKFMCSNLELLKKAHLIVWEETGKVPGISKVARLFKGSKVIRDILLL